MTLFLTKNLYFRTKQTIRAPWVLFSQFVLCLTSNNSTSRNVGGTDAWTVPHFKFWGDRFLQSPLSIRRAVTSLRLLFSLVLRQVTGCVVCQPDLAFSNKRILEVDQVIITF